MPEQREEKRMVEIRKIAKEDAGAVRALVTDIMQAEFAGAESEAYTLHDLEDPVRYYGGENDIFLVAEKDGAIIGTIAIKEDAPGTALLRRMFVRKEFRGKGYGDKLIGKAVEFCFARGYRTVSFKGTDRMRRALNLCLKQGFEENDVVVTNEFKMFVLTKNLKRPAGGNTV